VLQTYSFRANVGLSHLLSGSPVIIGIIDGVVTGVLVVIVCQALGAAVVVQIAVGLLMALATAGMLAAIGYRRIGQLRRDYRARFPSGAGGSPHPGGGDAARLRQ
jgi:hypothetical protein